MPRRNHGSVRESGDQLHDFWNKDFQRSRVAIEEDTAHFIRTLWRAGTSLHNDPDFLAFLIRCGWNNEHHGKGIASTVEWRNTHLAECLQLSDLDNDTLAEDLGRRFRSLRKDARKLLRMRTGIAHCYGAVRAVTLEFAKRKPDIIAAAFREVASRRKPKTKLGRVMKLIDRQLADRAGRRISLLNGITPTLACLDPAERFPIVNGKTRRLLKELGQKPDHDGAMALHRMIGELNIKNSFELDVYAATQFPRNRRKGRSKRRRRPKD